MGKLQGALTSTLGTITWGHMGLQPMEMQLAYA